MSEANGNQLQEIMKTAQRMQQEISKIQDELSSIAVRGDAGGGMVVAIANGKQQLLEVRIEKEVVNPEDIGMLQDLVVAAVNNALGKATELAQQEMNKLTGQMNLKLGGLF